MITGIKLVCFLALIGVALGPIPTIGTMVYQLMSVSPCSSEQECQEQYIHNIKRCVSSATVNGNENLCGNAIDPSYLSIQGDWSTKLDKIEQIANAEKQSLSPEALRAKQEHLRETLKEKSATKTTVIVAVSLSFAGLILPVICFFVDMYLAHKSRKVMLQGSYPSTLIILALCVFLAGIVSSIIISLTIFSASHFSLTTEALRGGVLLFLTAFAYLLAKATKQELLKFKGLARAVKQAKA